ncbi:MAG: prepilin-type N-terminal cleavage/methylation domain-containing protein [Elusimicrobiales bacterium]|nr:prepilin-type N-terminal cleavage/methylation domain-containing protein [Elusimicrobiales bacterium]
MRKGFTLIELLVVVLIMGILASVAMPAYFKSVEKSRSAEGIAWLSAVASAQERHYMKKGTYAETMSELDVGLSNLSYFTLFQDNGSGGGKYFGAKAVLQRTVSVGNLGFGQYSKYRLEIRLPAVPNGKRDWSCVPRSSGCEAFLPKPAGYGAY